ncbi:hypothetical protein [Carboxydothermus pertinax]|uniref:Methionine synthase n=1 Tax=Carboxydothermus pertinax TaxID=870242 RepID=A0A1L8CYH0_9THEO|nr:hypothetical protein [Carboxydothermus pertinax]GAV23978.1 hypothetical protein cpu_24880 [Carboxydothermus pertinax]
MLKFPPFATTAMGIMPHTNIDEAISLALTLDIPFFPELPKLSFYEDMYAQASQNFPGILIDQEKEKIILDTDVFGTELLDFLEKAESSPELFDLTHPYSLTYEKFLAQDLSGYPAIRGQLIGPISYGLKITDKNLTPILYNDEIKEFLFYFLAKKANIMYQKLQQKNNQAFIWFDEPGLEFIFNSFSGYPNHKAHSEYLSFLSQIEGPKGVHLCGNPDWSFLLTMPLEILSLDVFTNGPIFKLYTNEIATFLERGAVIVWGIVPTWEGVAENETSNSLFLLMKELIEDLISRGINREMLLFQSALSPARCSLVNKDETLVTRAFQITNRVKDLLRNYFL